MVADTPFPELVLEVVLEVVLPRTEAEAVSVRVFSNLVAQKRKRADSQILNNMHTVRALRLAGTSASDLSLGFLFFLPKKNLIFLRSDFFLFLNFIFLKR